MKQTQKQKQPCNKAVAQTTCSAPLRVAIRRHTVSLIKTMPKQFDLIVFDWDGTLFDSTLLITQSLQAAAVAIGVPPPSDARASHVIGLGLIDALRYAMPDLEEARYRELAEHYRDHYLARDADLNLFGGVHELIDQLRDAGHMLAVATGKPRRGLLRAFAASGLGPKFHGSRCADECQSKPHPQMLEELFTEFGVNASSVLMIGDTTHDMLMASNAGCAGLGVTYGAHSHETLLTAAPLHCVDSIPELSTWLQKNA